MKIQQSHEEALISASNIRSLIIKAAKERLNATLKVHHEPDVREHAWRLYDDAIRAAWDAHSAMVRSAESIWLERSRPHTASLNTVE
jgi:hypothetical protein